MIVFDPQAKGVWFATARRQVLAEHGEGALGRIALRMGDEHAQAMLEPIVSAWYPETTFQRAMSAVFEETCSGDSERFVEFIESCTVLGINRFLRFVLALSSPAYLLGKMPVLWARHRLHNGKLRVDVGERSARLAYTEFPFFDDRNYRLFVRGVLRKSVEVTSGHRPEVTVRDYGKDRLLVDVHFAAPKTRIGVPAR